MLSVEQSNSSLIYGEQVFVKVFRRIQSGVNPDAEILRVVEEQSSQSSRIPTTKVICCI